MEKQAFDRSWDKRQRIDWNQNGRARALLGEALAIDAINQTTHAIIGAAIEVHRILGPGLLETAYEECLCRELTLREIPFGRQTSLSVEYKGVKVDCAYRVDLVVRNLVVVEIKAIETILPVHEAQLLTYLRVGGWKAGLLLNFNVPVMRDGICRRIFNLVE